MSRDSAAWPEGWSPLDPARREALLALWLAHYGVAPSTFDALVFWERLDSGSLWAMRDEHPLPRLPSPETAGLRVRRGRKPDVQVANGFLRRYFAGASRHVARLESPDEVQAWFDAVPIPIDPRPPWLSSGEDGYWVVLSPWGALGRARVSGGVLTGEPSRGERGLVAF